MSFVRGAMLAHVERHSFAVEGPFRLYVIRSFSTARLLAVSFVFVGRLNPSACPSVVLRGSFSSSVIRSGLMSIFSAMTFVP